MFSFRSNSNVLLNESFMKLFRAPLELCSAQYWMLLDKYGFIIR